MDPYNRQQLSPQQHHLLPPDAHPSYRQSVKRRSITPSPGALANLSNLQQPPPPRSPSPSSRDRGGGSNSSARSTSSNKPGGGSSQVVKLRSKSSTRYSDVVVEEENKSRRSRYAAAAGASLMSIPNAVKLSMLSSGFISIQKVSSEQFSLFVFVKRKRSIRSIWSNYRVI